MVIEKAVALAVADVVVSLAVPPSSYIHLLSSMGASGQLMQPFPTLQPTSFWWHNLLTTRAKTSPPSQLLPTIVRLSLRVIMAMKHIPSNSSSRWKTFM